MGWRRRLAALAGAVLAAASLAGGAAAAPAMWRVTDGDSEVYLFGTLHALPPGLAWRTPLYDRVMARAGTVWFEADMTSGDPETIRLLVQRYGLDPDTPLSRKLAPSDLAVLSRQADLARIDHLRPWAAALMLSVRPVLGRGSTVEAGADMTATRAARQAGKRLMAFETLEDQARMYAGLPPAAEVRYLAGVVRERSRPRLPLRLGADSLERAWMAGDVARLNAGLEAENPALYEALVLRRNRAWADRLAEEMAATSGVMLVNVGALHLIGPQGLPSLLRARGRQVVRVQ
ncbi:TraB/GumN family protein [Phenylobacterium sp.]|uniref:TraB/GumN family protein n=1 Tax=Phenylobacterium sp. TaxID=1871053 RepID=UPI0025E58C4D|nr:TraB/GumN family protein [Phenylobacterium sp.]